MMTLHGITFVIFKEFSLPKLNEEDMNLSSDEEAEEWESEVST